PVYRGGQTDEAEKQDPVPDENPVAPANDHSRPRGKGLVRRSGLGYSGAGGFTSPAGRGAAARAGAASPQQLEGVDPGVVSVAPVDPEPVGAHQREGPGPDVARDRVRLEQAAPGHLLDASGAGTGQPELPGGIEPGMAVRVPLDEDTGRLPGDRMGHRWQRHCRNLVGPLYWGALRGRQAVTFPVRQSLRCYDRS